jgi:hypothetical protein
MSLLASKFDIQSVDNPLAVAALAQVLEVAVGATSGLYSGGTVATDFSGGTPLTGAVSIPPGTIVEIASTGLAAVATSTVAGTELVAPGVPKLLFVAIDGNTDYSGAFVRKVTVLHGGMTIVTDQYLTSVAGYVPGEPVHVVAGKIARADSAGAIVGARTFGFVGPLGLNVATGVLQVIVPQGAGI